MITQIYGADKGGQKRLVKPSPARYQQTTPPCTFFLEGDPSKLSLTAIGFRSKSNQINQPLINTTSEGKKFYEFTTRNLSEVFFHDS